MSTRTITFRHRVDDALTDVTSVVLSDPAAAYGVRRLDTLAVVVPAGTPLEKQSDGVYSVSFEEPAAGVVYGYWLEWVYDGATYRQERTLAATPLVADPTGYLTALADAEFYASQMFGLSAWGSASEADKVAALSEASRRIDAQRYQGAKYDPDQELAFPRRPYPDRSTVWDRDVAGDPIVPGPVLLAVVAEADYLLTGGATKRQQRHDGLVSQSAGPVSESYAQPRPADAARPQLCERAATLVARYRLKSGRLL